jgi:glyoxylase I family protein
MRALNGWRKFARSVSRIFWTATTLGSVRVELDPANPATPKHQKVDEQAVGFRHLAFDVPKLEPVIEALGADGVEPDPIEDVGELIPGLRVAFFRDPEGNILELLEGYRDEE